jgi:hypothetical protein
MRQHPTRHAAAIVALALALVTLGAPRLARAYDSGYRDDRYEQRHRGDYNDEYIFATTRMVSELDVHPAFKVPLFPPAIVIDVVFLPAEVIAGLF